MKIELKEDYIIPKGTIFNNCDGEETSYVSGNFHQMFGTGKDGVIDVYLTDDVLKDNPKIFKINE